MSLLRTLSRNVRPSTSALPRATLVSSTSKRLASSYESDLGGLTDEQLEVRVAWYQRPPVELTNECRYSSKRLFMGSLKRR